MSDSKSKIEVNSFNLVSLSTLNNWSCAGFQSLRDNHIIDDLIEAVLSETFDRSKAMNYVYNFAYGRVMFTEPKKPVSGKQIVELFKSDRFGQLLEDTTNWTNFFDLLNFLSGASGWFGLNKLDWEARDKFREELGLKLLNPVFENADGLKIVFRLTGRCDVWENPPDGYRYASLREASLVNLESIERSVVYFSVGVERFGVCLQKTKQLNFVNSDYFPWVRKLFRNSLFYIPLVKIEV